MLRRFYGRLDPDLKAIHTTIRVDLPNEGKAAHRLQFGVRPNTWDENILTDVVAHDEYRIGRYLGPRATILDIGAHIGGFCTTMKRVFPASRVVAVEPADFNIPVLMHNMALAEGTTYGEPIVAFHNAIGQRDLLPVIVRRDSEENTGGGKAVPCDDDTPFVVRTVTLATICREMHLTHFDLVKMHCEEGEHDLLADNHSRIFLKRSAYVVAEVHGRHDPVFTWFRDNFKHVETVVKTDYIAMLYAWQDR